MDSTFSDYSGNYSFEVAPGNYYVSFQAPYSWDFTSQDVGSDDLDSDAGLYGQTAMYSITDSDITNVDAGLVPLPYGSIVSKVWLDMNGNGLQDAEEVGKTGVEVYLVDSTGNYVTSAISEEGGFYRFDNVAPGSYQVGFVLPFNHGFTQADQGMDEAIDSDVGVMGLTGVFTLALSETKTDLDAGLIQYAAIGDFVWWDANANGIQDAGETGVSDMYVGLYTEQWYWVASTYTDAAGNYSFEDVAPGSYRISFGMPMNASFTLQDQGGDDALDSDAGANGQTDLFTVTAGQHRTDIDAGLVPASFHNGSIGNRVWWDANANGIQDAGETGVSDMYVGLYTEQWYWVGSTYTDASGHYSFADVAPGSYRISFGMPMNGSFTLQDQGGDDALDSDAGSYGQTAVFTLAAQQHRTDIDAGLVPYPSLGDFVWQDANGNGVQDVGELGAAGVYVSLFDSHGYFAGSATTDANGYYLFNHLYPGTYRIQVSAPMYMTFTQQDAGTDDGLDSDVDSYGYSAYFTLAAGQNNFTLDAGLVSSGGGGGENQPPQPMLDNAVTTVGIAVTINVLANDFDPDGDLLSVTEVTSAQHGMVMINSDFTILYTPTPGYEGQDIFNYTVSDGRGGTAMTMVYLTVGQPQQFAGQEAAGGGGTGPSARDLQAALAVAMARWSAAGFATDAFANVRLRVTDLHGNLLGAAHGNEIWLDRDAAGYGWYTDSSGASDGAFGIMGGGDEHLAAAGSAAFGQVDLLTVLMHELGHLLGFNSLDPTQSPGELMTATIGTGVRRTL